MAADTIIVSAENWCRKRDGMGADWLSMPAGVKWTLQIAMAVVSRPNGQILKLAGDQKPCNFLWDPYYPKEM